ncbi:MAG: urate hydroxylase PuuD, partial [Candidatus Binatia bacterium]
MDVMNLIESLFRWIHVVAGIVWIGHLYFFNWVNSQFEPTLDAETKKKVIPELRPRALYWFRWGAAFTWVTGVVILLIVFYHGGVALEDIDEGWGPMAILMIVITFGAVFLYDYLAANVIKDAQQQFYAGIVAAAVAVFLMAYVGGFSYRGYAVHLGSMFGTTMAFNVWFRIWPAQQKIISAIKNGQAPDAALVALAGSRSKHNTYMSVPLVFMMISQHAVGWATSPLMVTLVVIVGFVGVYHLYN